MRIRKQPDTFAEAIAKVTQEPPEPELVEAPYVLQNRQSLGIAVSFAAAAAVAAFAALIFVIAFPASQGPAEEDTLASLPTWQSLKSSLYAAPQRKPAPTLVVRDGGGPANEPLSLGVNVNAPGPGAIVIIGGMPAGARLTVGKAMNSGEWRVPAQEISDASIIPPADFVGVMNLTAELRSSDGDALVSSQVRLTWTPASTVGVSASTATVPSVPATTMPSVPAAPTSQQQQTVAPPAPSAPARAALPAREINPDEIAGFIRRAQELLVAGDLQAARLLLLRAAEARDVRAALALAKTFDPIVSKQFGVADQDVDLAQARNWYQKAEEWGAPEARRQLEALASYAR
ncbi:hypothetical protein [Bradyrhizobium sp.]|uniref:hypothetical protein n=1 Tax=Bradyrhizobium sp. TaxID=376 RepID=UPI003C76BAED